jgi:hypothetical protein
MAAFVSISNPSSIDEKSIKAVHRTTAEDGKPGARARYTASKSEFTLNWDNLSNADYISLKTFFKANQGVEFTYTNILDSVTYNVIFGDDWIEGKTTGFFDAEGKNCMACSVKLLEV